MPINRPGRPEITKPEQEALARMAKSADGSVLLSRLAKVRRHKQDANSTATDHDQLLLTNGAIQELEAIIHEFLDAEPEKPGPQPDRQKRF